MLTAAPLEEVDNDIGEEKDLGDAFLERNEDMLDEQKIGLVPKDVTTTKFSKFVSRDHVRK